MRFRKGWVAGIVLSAAVASVTVWILASMRPKGQEAKGSSLLAPVASLPVRSATESDLPAKPADVSRAMLSEVSRGGFGDNARQPPWRRRAAGTLLAVLMLAAAVHNTASNFNAQTRNPGNAFSTGTLVLANTKSGSTTCLSTSGGSTDSNTNSTCDTLIDVSVRVPGDQATGRLTLRNNGSLNASALQFALLNCTTSNAPGEAFNGSGNLCSTIRVYVQEFSDSGFTNKSSCRYGGGTATVCDYSDAAKTLSALQTATTTPLGLSAQNASASRYFEIGIQLPTSAGNDMQGRRATFDLSWTLQQ